MLAMRGVVLTYETVREWCLKFGQTYANGLRHNSPRPGDRWLSLPKIQSDMQRQLCSGSLAVACPELFALSVSPRAPSLRSMLLLFKAHQLTSSQLLRSTFQPITLRPLSDNDDADRLPAGET